MKTRLLKKIRKRYKIKYYPNHLYWWGNVYYGEFVILHDNNNGYRKCVIEIKSDITDITDSRGFNSEKSKNDAKKIFMDTLSKWIKNDYAHIKKNKKQKIENIWYNK